MLMGLQLIVYTDHKNLTFRTFSVQHILRWHLFVNQFACILVYIPGQKMVLADCFSRLPLMKNSSAMIREQQGCGRLIGFLKIQLPKDEDKNLEGAIFTNLAWDIV